MLRAGQMEVEKSEEIPNGDGGESPMSPLSKLVKRAQPQFAVVRSVSLRDPPVRSQTPEPHRQHYTRPVSASKVHRVQGEQVHELTQAQVEERSRQAASYFHRQHSINSQARTPEEIEAVIAEARRRRAASGTPTNAGQDVASAGVSVFRRNATSRQNSKKMSAGGATPTAEPTDADDNHRARSPGDDESQAARRPSQTSGVGDLANTNQDVQQKPPPRSLMEKFGYGVKPKSNWSQLRVAAVAVQATQKMKAQGMVEVSAGKNDLLQRLAAKRNQTIE